MDLIEAMYDGEIRFTDDTLSKTFAVLQEISFFDNYMVVITSDHGEEFGEHGGLSHTVKLYDEMLHVPLIVVGSDVQGGRVDDRMASSIDILPTVLNYVGIDTDIALQGRDILAARSQPEDDQVVFTRISVLALARPQYTSAPARMPRLFALNPAHPLRR